MTTLLIRTMRPEWTREIADSLGGPDHVHILSHPRADLPAGYHVIEWHREWGDFGTHAPLEFLSTLADRYEMVAYGVYHHPTRGMANVIALANLIKPSVLVAVYPNHSMVEVNGALAIWRALLTQVAADAVLLALAPLWLGAVVLSKWRTK
jgi:hypothetical protein